MQRQDILDQIRAITTDLNAKIDIAAMGSNAKKEATQKLDLLKQHIIATKPNLLVDMYQILLDSDVISFNTATIGFLVAYAESMKKTSPALEVQISNRRALPARLLKYIVLLSNIQPLSEQIIFSKKTADPKWLDPITSAVMNIPVSYSINNVELTVDLFTLLNNSSNSIGLRCPLTKQSLFLSDLRPRIDIVKQVQEECKGLKRIQAKNDQEQFLAALTFIQNNDLAGLKNFHDSMVDMDINIQFPELNDDTLLHHACRLNRFEIAIWLLTKQAFIGAVNNDQMLPVLLIDPTSLDTAIASDPNNAGLIYLKALSHYNPMNPAGVSQAHRDEYFDNIDLAVSKKFVPAMIQRGAALCTYDNPNVIVKGIKILRDALRLNSGMAAIVLHHVFANIIPTKPLVKVMLQNETTNITVVDATNINGVSVNNFNVNNGDNAVNIHTITRDLLAVLASEEPLDGRWTLEEKAAEMLYEMHHKDRGNKGYATIIALCLASNAVAKGSSRTRELLSKIMTLLRVEKIGAEYLAKIQQDGLGPFILEETVSYSQDYGLIKPWVPLKFSYGR